MAVTKRILALALAAALAASPAGAELSGEVVQRGNVSIHRDGSVTAIDASDGAIIQFDRFDVLRHETVRFNQPSESARVLNRVLGRDPSRIDGSLFANGHVYILNSAGVFIGGEAVIDVGGLVAAAGHLSDADFLAGVDRFTDVTGSVENHGSIRADVVGLIGRTVANLGSIVSDGGMIALAAGEEVFLTSRDGRVVIQVAGPPAEALADLGAGVRQGGLLDAGTGSVNLTTGDAYALAINHTGITRGLDVEMDGGATGRVDLAGEVDASNAVPGGRGGSVRVLGDRIALGDVRIDASGEAGGGEVKVGGALGGGGALPAARRTYVSRDAEIAADALSAGDGGEVVVWADEVTGFEGRISARGGERGGDGGFVEVSGREQLVYRGTADLRAPAGETGTLLLDPGTLTIVAGDGGAGDGSLNDLLDDGAIRRGDGGAMETITQNALQMQSMDSNVVLEATEDVVVNKLDNDELLLGENVFTVIADADADGDGGFYMKGAGTDKITTQGGDVIILGAEIVDGLAPTGAAIVVGAIGTSGIDAADVPLPTDPEEPTIVNGGRAGAIRLDASRGDIVVMGNLTAIGGEARTMPTAGDPEGVGGAGGTILLFARQGSVEVTGDANSSGGLGAESGGSAGRIQLSSTFTPAVLDPDPDREGEMPEPPVPGDVTVTGTIRAVGGASGPKPMTPEEGVVYNGGAGGAVVLDAVGGSVDLTGDIVTFGGAGDDAGGNAGSVVLFADAIAAVTNPDGGAMVSTEMPGNVTFSGGTVNAGGGVGTAESDGSKGVLSVEAEGAIDLDFTASPDIERLDITQRAAEQATDVLVNTASVLDVDGTGAMEPTEMMPERTPGRNAVTVNTSGAAAGLDLVYAIEEEGAAIDLVAPNAITLSGGSAELRAPGDIVVGDGMGTVVTAMTDASVTLRADSNGDGVGALQVPELTTGVHIQSGSGDVTLQGTTIGDFDPDMDPAALVAPVRISSEGGTLGLVARGEADAVVTGTGFDAIAITQRDAEADVDVSQGATVVDIVAGVAGDGTKTSTLGVTTATGVDFAYRLDDLEADLLIPDANDVNLRGVGVLRSGGDVVIGAEGTSGTPITTSGSGLVIEADANGNRTGSIVRAGSATSDIEFTSGAPALILAAGGAVGEPEPGSPAAGGPIRTMGDVDLAGVAQSGGFHVDHAGALTLTEVSIADPSSPGDPVDIHGIVASGDVELRNTGTATQIALAGDGARVLVSSGGSQDYGSWGAAVLEENVVLNAGGDVDLDVPIDTDAGAMDDRSLAVNALGTTSLGAVGTTRPLAGLVTDAFGTTRIDGSRVVTSGPQVLADAVTLARSTTFEAESHRVAGDDGEMVVEREGGVVFGSTLDGDGVAITVEAESRAAFLGNVGTTARPDSLDVGGIPDAGTPTRTESIELRGSIVRVGNGGIRLNGAGDTQVPSEATIFRAGGPLAIETPGEFAMGAREKLTVGGAFRLTAGSAELGDVNAERISVSSDDVTLLAREPGAVLGPGGELVMDDGLDLVADEIVFSSRPDVEDVTGLSDAPAPTFVTRNGGLRIPGNIGGFRTRLFDADGGSVTGALAGGDRRDLLGTGPSALGNPATEVVRPRPEVLPPPRRIPESGAAPTWEATDVGSGDVYAFLQGSEAAAPGSPLDTPRGRELLDGYRALREDTAFRERALAELRTAVEAVRAGDGSVDPDALGALLDESGDYESARAYLAAVEAAATQVRLLDLSAPVAVEIRERLVADLLGGEPIDGLDPASLVGDPVQDLVDQIATQ